MGWFRVLTVLSLCGILIPRHHFTRAAIVNRTIDDTDGDSHTRELPQYFPTTQGVWKDASCTNCAINPDVSQAFKRTYTAATSNPASGKNSITLRFNGTAIYIFFILANNAGDNITSVTDCNFIIDNDDRVPFRYAPDLTRDDYLYNQLVFSRTDLPFAAHVLEIAVEADFNSYVNFDYAIYTYDDDPSTIIAIPSSTSTGTSIPASTATATGTPTDNAQLPESSTHDTSNTSNTTSIASPSTSSPGSPIAAIAGGIAGGVGMLLLIFLAFFLCRRRKRRRQLEKFRNAPPILMDETDHAYDPRADPFNDANAVGPGPHDSSNGTLSLGRGTTINFGPSYGAQHAPHSHFYPPANSRTSASQYSAMTTYTGMARSLAPSSDDRPRTVTSGTASVSGSSGDGQGHFRSASSEKRQLRLNILEPDEIPPPPLYLRNGAISHPSSTGADRASGTMTVVNPDSEQERLRIERQEAIGMRLRTVQQEMHQLGKELKRTKGDGQRGQVTGGGDGGAHDVDGQPGAVPIRSGKSEISMMREEMRLMQQEIELLRENQSSAWAQGLSNEPPPGYSQTAPASVIPNGGHDRRLSESRDS